MNEENEILSYGYDSYWPSFKEYVRTRYSVPSLIMRRCYAAGCLAMAHEIRSGKIKPCTIPLKIRWFQLAEQEIGSYYIEQQQPVPNETVAYRREVARQKEYQPVYRLVGELLTAASENGQPSEWTPEERLQAVRKVAALQGHYNDAWLARSVSELLANQEPIVAYCEGILPEKERKILEKRVQNDADFGTQYDMTLLTWETERAVCLDIDTIRVVHTVPERSLERLMKEKQKNRYFIWQAAIVALLLLLLKCFMNFI